MLWLPSPREVTFSELLFHNIKITKTYTYSNSHFYKRVHSVCAIRRWLWSTPSVLYGMGEGRSVESIPLNPQVIPRHTKPESTPQTCPDTQAASCLVQPKPPGSDLWFPTGSAAVAPHVRFHRDSLLGSLSNQARKWQARPDSSNPPNNGRFLVCFERLELWLPLSSTPQQRSEAHPAREHKAGSGSRARLKFILLTLFKSLLQSKQRRKPGVYSPCKPATTKNIWLSQTQKNKNYMVPLPRIGKLS